jgi:hypothetical protein
MTQYSRIGNQYPNQHNAFLKQVKKDPARFMINLMRAQFSLYNKEIAHWKSGRIEALDIYNPRRVQQTELYKDIELDGFIRGVKQNRVLRISNKPFRITGATGQEDESKTQLLKPGWFRKFVKQCIEARFHGHSVIYLNNFNKLTWRFESIELVPRDHVIPEFNAILKDPYGAEYMDYCEAPLNRYVIPVDGEEGLGLYDAAAPLYILKKHSWQSWDEFEEKFGIPLTIIKSALQDAAVLNTLQSTLNQIGSAANGIIPQDTELEVHENKQTDAWSVFNEKRKAANEELEILIMGLKNASQEAGTYGKQLALKDEVEEVTKDDLAFVADIVNDKLIPLLRSYGYPFAQDDEFVWDNTEKLTPKEILDIFKGAHDLGYELDQEEVAEKLGINLVGKLQQHITEPNAKQFLEVQNKINKLYL